MHFYLFNIGDFVSHTHHLSLMEKLAYRLLLDHYYLHERPLNGCSTEIARMIGMREHSVEVEDVLKEFFVPTDAGWVNKRAEKEIANYAEKSEKAAMAGRASGVKRALNVRSADVELNKKQETRNKKQETLSKSKSKTIPPAPPAFDAKAYFLKSGIDPKVAEDWLTLRRTKRLPATETAISGIQREAKKASLTLEDALRLCCERGWGGFKAAWATEINRKENYHDRHREFVAELTGKSTPTDGGAIDGQAERVG